MTIFSVAQQNQQTRLNIIRFPECRHLKLYSALAIPIPGADTQDGEIEVMRPYLGIKPERCLVGRYCITRGRMCKNFWSLQFFLTLSSKYLRTHVCIAMQLPRGSRRKGNIFHSNWTESSHVTICLIQHIEHFLRRQKHVLRLVWIIIVLLLLAAGDQISLKLLIQD